MVVWTGQQSSIDTKGALCVSMRRKGGEASYTDVVGGEPVVCTLHPLNVPSIPLILSRAG